MNVTLKKIPVTHICKGMYISKLDRPWLETPFLFQGFSVMSEKEITILHEHCEYVFIDEHFKNDIPAEQVHSILEPESRRSSNKNTIPSKNFYDMLPGRKPDRYQDSVSMQDELKTARKIKIDIEQITEQISSRSHADKGIDVVMLKQAVDPLINSIIRNPDAMIWLARLKSSDNYSYHHSMSTSIWAVSLGRQLGLPKNELRILAIGVLLCDIGKLKIPSEILSKRTGLSAGEFEIIKKHVDYSLELLNSSKGFNEQVFHIVANHHERHAGHGYPRQLVGDEIPIFSRIAGIADCYDAITSDRPHAIACSPSVAIKK